MFFSIRPRVVSTSNLLARSCVSATSRSLFGFSSSTRSGPAALLKSRELLSQSTSDLLLKQDFYATALGQNATKPISAYAGFDPTADSLHLGNLISILTMVRLSLLGIKPILLVGGATGLIGDPSGKTNERNMLSREDVLKNVKGIETTLRTCTGNIYAYLRANQAALGIESVPSEHDIKILNNYDFYKDMNILDFIRDIGKHYRMGTLLNKETIANRLSSEDGLSYTEFTYTLLQGYDFERLLLDENCVLQVGGSDQWGNITSGIELIRRKHRKEVYGLTTNLVLTASGKKFGKSEGNALWLDPTKTKAYDIHQYLINVPDDLAVHYLKMFTFLPLDSINEIERKHREDPGKRLAQNTLSEHMIGMVQGVKGSSQSADGSTTQSTAQKFFTTPFETFKEKSRDEIEEFFRSFEEKHVVDRSKHKNFIDLVADLKLLKTKAEARRNIENGGAYVNNERISIDEANDLPAFFDKHLLADKYLVVRFGKKSYFLVEVTTSN